MDAGRREQRGGESPGRRGHLLQLVATGFLCGAAGLAAGTFVGSPVIRAGHAKPVAELRGKTTSFVRPLLECARPREAAENLELSGVRRRAEAAVRDAVAAGLASRVSVYVGDLDVGTWFSVNPGERYVPASLLKVPVLIALLRQTEEDPQLLQRRVVYDGTEDLARDQSVRPGEPLVPGTAYTLGELARRMIVDSDNNAARLVLGSLPDGALEHLYADLGVDLAAGARGESLISIDAYAMFFRILYNGTYLSRRANDIALSLLARRTYRGGLRAGIPAQVPVAAKFGEWRLGEGVPDREQLHDCGVVYEPGHPYLLCVMTRGPRFEPLGDVIAQVARAVHGEVDAEVRPRATVAGVSEFPPP